MNDRSPPTDVALAPETHDHQPAAGPRRLRWTVDAYVGAIERGAFPPTLRAELIAGEILEKMPIGDAHAYVTRQLTRRLMTLLGDRAVVGTQDPVQLSSTSRPEPDVWLASPPPRRYAQRAPAPDDLLLVCEVADATLAFDRGTKLALYAAAAVPEYWILNVAAAELERYTDPRPDGSYGAKAVYGRDATLAHPLLGAVTAGELFPPAAAAQNP